MHIIRADRMNQVNEAMATASSFRSIFFLFWYTILLTIPHCHICVVSLSLDNDIQSLRRIKEAIDPNSVSTTSFLYTWKFKSDPCEPAAPHFLGILCTIPDYNSSSRVTVINLEGDGLEGFLTPTIGNFTELTTLNLRKNKFRGPIPITISNLRKLTKLLLSDNFFSGTVPAAFSRLKALEEMDMSRNSLSGAISPNITAIRSLTRLTLSGNQLSGKIPDLTGLWQLKILDLSGNQLYGSLPLFPPSLTILLLNKNLMSGHVSSFKRLRNLQTIDISENRFSGPIEGYLLALPLLTSLNASANVFSEMEVIKRTDQTSNLQVLSAQNNRLHGHLPINLVNYESLREVYLGHNLFTGWIPRQYGQKLDGSWKCLFLDYNYLQGTPPPEFSEGRKHIQAEGSLEHNCLDCLKNTTFCAGGQRVRADCLRHIGEGGDGGGIGDTL